ncbi:MAG TPA: LPS export ABC transporter periplasmic protein LptC [Alphaproteobacteria bacterium]|jgi:lipopolysaccharide export system protein LptC|nr:LPS export ABC transporter periplasmic protein LptC [Alphaproteobacteria bacterium]
MAFGAAPSRVARPAKSRRNHRVGLSEGGARFVAIAGLKQFSDGYTWFVGFLKLALPSVAVVLVGLVLMWPQLKGAEESLRKSVIGSLKLDEIENLQMVQARYVGTDEQNRPYVLTAAAARQMSSGSDLIALEVPKGQMSLQDGNQVALAAQAGAYYQKAQMLDLFGAVTMKRSDGYVVETEEARINLKTGSAEGNKTVTGHGPAGTLRSDGFRILDKGDTVIFTGKARLVINAESADAKGMVPGLSDLGGLGAPGGDKK